ncbi:PDZ domain-containing protein [Psychrosphaera haliotis]|uniref:M61 family metallopeptidase n=1 Tax=Psychrosphaera haliotis TaxID=555083 RepID=UPI0031E3FDC1
MSTVNYHFSIEDPNAHLFNIKIEYTPLTESVDELYLPNWIPGSYMIRDFAKHVLEIKAFDKHGSLALHATDKSTFKLQHNNKPVTIEYKYYAFDLSVRKAYLDQQYGFINPASSCFAIKGHEHQVCNVILHKPTSSICKNWLPASGLSKGVNTKAFSWGEYSIEGYLAFTDYPILFGELDIASFEINQIPHHVVTVGQHFGSLARVAKDLTPLCQFHADMFGGLPTDVDQYLFLTMITDNGFGGLEHLNSTALVASRFDIINDDAAITDGYQTFLSLCSHEYLHTWNVKRLKPTEFIPYQLDKEVYTDQLWFYEGMTSYFDDFSLVATNTISNEAYLNALAKALTRLERGKGQLRQSVTESSFLTWTKFYQQDDTAPDQIVSYYVKGAVIACFADIAIRKQSNGEQSLKDLMQTAWVKFGVNNLGTTQQDLESLFSNFLSGEDYSIFLELLHSKEKVNLKETFKRVGLDINYYDQYKPSQWFKPVSFMQTQSNEQAQSLTQKAIKNTKSAPWLGAVLANVQGNIVVRQVLEGSPAQQAGIATGDTLVAFNNLKINSDAIEPLLINAVKDSDNVIHYFRKDLLYRSDITFGQNNKFVAGFTIEDKDKLSKWLN